ncbi:MAG: hypothetical protein HUU37_07315, partial [Bdellovibrionales bacterium]|nr:hypothetical protein [Bdellovibrionales bacterium]
VSGPFSTATLCEEIDKILLRLPDNHLHARTVLGLSRARESQERPGSVGPNVLAGQKKAWGLTRDKKLPILSIMELPDVRDAAWRGFREAVEEALRSPALVIDVRGNPGGSDLQPQWLASRLLGGAPVASPYESVRKSETPATWALAVNNVTLKIRNLTRQGKSIPAYLLEKREAYRKSLEQAQLGGLPEERVMEILPEQTHAAGEPYTGTIYVLQDSDCGSSCESLLEFLETNPRVVTVGENSAGSVHFGNVGMVVLPHSGIVVQIATDFWRYRDGRYVEKTGYAPHIRVPPGKDALDVVRSLRRKRAIRWESKLESDGKFLRNHAAWLGARFSSLERYFGISLQQPLLIQVMPVEENPSSRSCARTYGPSRIYAHSLESLQSLTPEQRREFHTTCFERSYEDLRYTLVHEYVHALVLTLTDRKVPQWLWEGAAVALSGQLEHTKMGVLGRKYLEPSFCASGEITGDPYLAGGATLLALERRSPGIIRELILRGHEAGGVLRVLSDNKAACASLVIPSSASDTPSPLRSAP